MVSRKGKEGVGVENRRETAGAKQVKKYLKSDTTDEWI